LKAMAVFGLAHAGFQRAENAQFALDRDAARVGHFGDAARDVDVVLVRGGGLGVFFQPAVHHHRGEAVLDGGGAGGRAVAVVLVHTDRNMRILLDQGVDQAGQNDIVGVGAGAARGRYDARGVDGVGGFHDGQVLLHVVDVGGGQAVVVLRRVVEQLSQRN